MESIFQPKRFFALLSRDFQLHWKTILIGAGTFTGIIFLNSFFWAVDRDSDVYEIHQTFFPLVLFLGGYLFTSGIFNEMDQLVERQFYLSIPASHFEKVASKWLISGIGFVSFVILGYGIFSFANNLLVEAMTSIAINPFNPFEGNGLNFILIYLVTHAVFFLGAVSFRKLAFGKTILSLFVFLMIIAIILFFVFRISFHEFFESWRFTAFDNPNLRPHPSMEEDLSAYIRIVKWIFWLLLAPVLWVGAYFKLTEKEG